MIGTQLRLKKLLPDGENIIILPVDHGEFTGPRKGLVNTHETANSLSGYNALLLSPGQFEHCWDIFAARKGLVSIVRVNWNSDYCFQWDYRKGITTQVLSPIQAAAMGVDVVLASLTVGTGDPAVDAANAASFAQVVAEARTVGLPVGGEIYPSQAGRMGLDEFHELVLQSCRMVSELGANFVKTFYTGERFHEVVAATPVPLIVLGAEKVNEAKALKVAADSMAAGARGVVFGRNVFESDRPQDFLKALGNVVYHGDSAKKAAREYNFN